MDVLEVAEVIGAGAVMDMGGVGAAGREPLGGHLEDRAAARRADDVRAAGDLAVDEDAGVRRHVRGDVRRCELCRLRGGVACSCGDAAGRRGHRCDDGDQLAVLHHLLLLVVVEGCRLTVGARGGCDFGRRNGRPRPDGWIMLGNLGEACREGWLYVGRMTWRSTWRVQPLADLALAGAVAAVGLVAALTAHAPLSLGGPTSIVGPRAVVAVSFFLAGAALWARRRWPLPALLAVAVALGVPFAVYGASEGFS